MSIDPKLQAVLTEIRTMLERTWAGTMGEDLRPWMNFSEIAEVGKFDFDGLLNIFDRKKLGDDYAKARQNDASLTRDIWIPKVSSDWLAGLQRDYMMRTRSRIRLMAHAAVWQKANSIAEGPLTVNTITMLTQLEAVQEE